MEVALNYRQFDAGWRIFEVMKEIDKHTLIIAVTLCWKAFMSLLRKPSEDEGTAELHETNDIQPDLIQWEARAWALYQRAQSMDHNSKHVAVDYITHRLIEIARESPQIESRREKLLRLQSK
jgi:hypothetical protein